MALLNKVDLGGNPVDIPSDVVLAHKAFSNIALDTLDSNNIYVYIEYINKHEANINLEPINTRIYKDLETGKRKKVYPLNLKDFKNKYKTIEPDWQDDNKDYYRQIRGEFFLMLTTNSQEEAVKSLIKKYKQGAI